ncbi:PTS fructose transporter subunit IIA [Lactonifactor longoviformis]|uniref:PTS system, mannose-specific IIA component n=1 Tax=Lactonifactor longoviformis DSM 17459 TaxID=1122155 RepID=A0A1M4UR47_9CLOT|nr:PTS sugar transporter subunit IIA [Lactonifactor longoviformis]POP31000.1 PTS fructose transporter subunit IIA [Lactonifactor longoviformis]SHE59083.1 PTS system, mannose-specific IIA component [Lactonifactor longoviformis DSM 17459]
MIGVLILSHGNLSKGLVHSAKMVAGCYKGAAQLSLMPGVAPEAFLDSVQKKIESLDQGKGVLILTDMKGGTPFISACKSLNSYPTAIVTGVNLSMAMEALMSNEDYDDLKEFAEAVAAVGHRGIETIFEIE